MNKIAQEQTDKNNRKGQKRITQIAGYCLVFLISDQLEGNLRLVSY